MIRVFFFLLKLALLVMLAVWLANHPGELVLHWQGYEVQSSVAVLLLAVGALMGLAVVVYNVWRAVVGVPRSLSLAHLSRRQRKGYLALTQGLVAVAAGDGVQARKLANKAEKLLNAPPLTLLLQAQAAQLTGDDQAAATYYSAMLGRQETSFLGLRGLMTQAIRSGDHAEALQLARRASVLQPKATWVLRALLDLEARNQNWDLALEALGKAVRLGAVKAEEARSLRATLLLALARRAEERGFADDALSYARKAYEQGAGFTPAAVHYAKLLNKAGKHKLAAKVLEQSWRIRPHPELVAPYAAAGGELTAAAQVRRIERLVSPQVDAVESRLAVAHAALSAQLWGVAEGQLTKALAREPKNRRALQDMAELADKLGQTPEKVAAWREKVAESLPDAAWVCSGCRKETTVWQPLCPQCQALGSFNWQQGSRPANVELLAPLISSDAVLPHPKSP